MDEDWNTRLEHNEKILWTGHPEKHRAAAFSTVKIHLVSGFTLAFTLALVAAYLFIIPPENKTPAMFFGTLVAFLLSIYFL